jgi:hypothetical protein
MTYPDVLTLPSLTRPVPRHGPHSHVGGLRDWAELSGLRHSQTSAR